jgi:TolB-like protein/class 3 adenylate cyclase
MSDGIQRRLAAIVAIDVVGYSRLMGADEPGTLARLKEYRAAIDPICEKHGGRIVGAAGDGMLLEFPSVVEAVTSAIEAQALMSERNAELPDDEKMLFRIGVNLGDVMIDGDDIYGDGVNIAARLEALADPGGVSLSDDAYRQVRDRLEIDWHDGGEHEVKNITRPIQVWHWASDRQLVSVGSAPDSELLPLPDKPSIAVLPFDNMSGDPEQEYFSDGITEDIITVLCRFSDLHVIARNSSFTYKGQSVDLRRVGRELGVRYVLEGSVRKAGNRIRITAQLIDAATGDHIWAERYDRPLDDTFEVQDEIAALVANTTNSELLQTAISRASRREADDLATWELAANALWHMRRFNGDDNAIGRQICQKLIEVDANSDRGYALLAVCHTNDALFGWTERTPEDIYADAERAARHAIEIEPNHEMGHRALGQVQFVIGRHEDAVRELELADRLCPGDARTLGLLGATLAYSGADHSERAIEQLQRAMSLSPRDHTSVWWHSGMAAAEFTCEHYEEAIEWAHKSLQINPMHPSPNRFLVSSLALTGDLDGARSALADMNNRIPGITIKGIRQSLSSVFKQRSDFDRYMEGLRWAGMPEE